MTAMGDMWTKKQRREEKITNYQFSRCRKKNKQTQRLSRFFAAHLIRFYCQRNIWRKLKKVTIFRLNIVNIFHVVALKWFSFVRNAFICNIDIISNKNRIFPSDISDIKILSHRSCWAGASMHLTTRRQQQQQK